MPNTNLSTRPFYNERAVRLLLGAVLLVIMALTAYHVVSALALRGEEGALSARATQARDEAERLRSQAQVMIAQIDEKEMAVLSAATREVNAAIDRRTFSWSAFLSDVEATLPGDVRVLSLQPRQQKGTIQVALNVEALDDDELAKFMDALDARGSFHGVLPRGQTHANDVIDATVEATYARPSPRPVEAGGRSGGRGRAGTPGGQK